MFYNANADRGGLAAIAKALSMAGAAKWNAGDVQSSSQGFANVKTVAEELIGKLHARVFVKRMHFSCQNGVTSRCKQSEQYKQCERGN